MVKSTAKRRSASPAAERATAQSEPARVTKQSVPPPSLSGANAEARSTARPLKAGKPQSVRASGGPAPGSREAAQQQAELDKSKADAGAEAAGPRRFRGAAPWAARHAAKRAAEFAARNQEPPRPGSARATLRTPEQAESIKARVTELHQLLNSLRSTKKHLKERFLEAGELLRRLRDEKLFEAKGYSSFESFVEREVDLGSKLFALRLVRIVDTFLPSAARELGLDPLLAALDTIDQTAQQATPRALRPPGRP